MTLRQKLLASFGAVACTTLLVGLISKFGLTKTLEEVRATSDRINQRRTFLAESINLARGAQVTFKIQVQEWKNILIRGTDQQNFDRYVTAFAKEETATQELLAKLQTLLATKEVSTQLVAETISEHAAMGVKYREALKQFDVADAAAGQKVDKLVRGIDRAANDKLDAVVAEVSAFEANSSGDDEARLTALQSRINLATNGTIAGGVLLAAILGFTLSRSISRRIAAAADALSSSSQTVAEASSQIDASTQELAEGATEQAASIEETSASITELASMTKRNAENAASAKTLATETRHAAETGTADMEGMVTAISEIKAASDNIGKIIKTVDEIAFQTNILALNAAVEAARAGEAGAGFAVVAEEVRNLAQRSAQAALETTRMIEDNIQKSERGVGMSAKVVTGLKHILDQARRVDELVAEIATASSEQSKGLDHISTAVAQMETVTQKNAASAEETASASNEVRAQMGSLLAAAGALNQLVGVKAKAAATTGRAGHPAQPVRKPAADELPMPAPRATASASPATLRSQPRQNGHGPVEPATAGKTPDEAFRDF